MHQALRGCSSAALSRLDATDAKASPQLLRPSARAAARGANALLSIQRSHGTSGALSPRAIGHYRLGLRREYAVTSTVLPPLVEGRPLGS